MYFDNCPLPAPYPEGRRIEGEKRGGG